MSALAHAKQPENTKSPQVQPAIQQAGPASNMEALGMLGMSALGKAASALSGVAPESLQEEVALMAQTSPGMLPVVLDALTDALLVSLLPKVLAFRAVRDWLLMTRPDLLSEIEGGAELLIDGLIPVGHSLKVSVEAELDETFKLAGVNSLQLTRCGPESWALVFEAEVAVKVGEGAESKETTPLPLGAVKGKAEADADLGIAQSVTANFSSDVSPDELMQALSSQLDVALLKSLVTDTLTSLVPDSVSFESAMTADLESKGDLKILGGLAPELRARLYEVSMEFSAGLSNSSRMTVTDQGLVTNEYSIEATTTIGPTLKGLLPNAMDLQRVATQESWSMTAVFEQGRFKHIVVNEDMNDMLSQRIYTDPKDLLSTQKDRYMGAGERLKKLAGGMSVTVREALPEEEVGQVSAQLQSVRLAGTGIDCDYQLQQTASFKAGQEIPDYLNTSNFAGSDLALFQGLVEIAHGGTAGALNLDQKTARSMLEIEPIRLVGDETAKKKIDDGTAELVGKISHSFDVAYTGPTKLF